MYDALGRRESKTISGTATNFLYDGLNLEQELNGTTPTVNYLTGENIDEMFSRTDSSGSYSYLTDNLGSTLALANSAGAISTSYSYEPYGNTTASGSSSTNALQYTGRENDGDGLYYYRARYYSPTYSRFISEDPAEYMGGIDLYAYASGNPISLSDPYGLFCLPPEIRDTVIGGIAGAVGGAVNGAITGGVIGAIAGAGIGGVAGAASGYLGYNNGLGGGVIGGAASIGLAAMGQGGAGAVAGGSIGGGIGGAAGGGIGGAIGGFIDAEGPLGARALSGLRSGYGGLIGGAVSDLTEFGLKSLIPACPQGCTQ
ncbi:MAG: RHS repeat-associated core domain-containing protein [Gammaproteobacteria bacterium]